MNIIKKIKQLDNNLFNNNIIKNNDTNYIIGFIVALLSSSILHDYIKVPYILECTISKLIFLIVIVCIARYNFTLSIILSILYTTLYVKSSPSVNENFTFYDADNDDDDDDDKPHPDEDPELEKMRLKTQESEEVDRIIDVDDEDNESDTSNTSANSDKDNKCLINCLKDNRKIDECKHICEDICDCTVKDTPNESSDIEKKNDSDNEEPSVEKKDNSKKFEVKQSLGKKLDGKKSEDKKTGKDDDVSKEQNNLDRLKKILNDDN